jgi:decaprenylphospho-beta-D-ribofuranose 2-oxidase
MKVERKTIADWGNYPRVESTVFTPENRAECLECVLGQPRVTPRGNGRSYGDAALGPVTISTLALNRVLSFNAETGILSCEAGVLLSDLIPRIAPAGWFFHVTPGTQYVTVGGAIACDVHGKNHPDKGCFSNWLISFELLLENGIVKTCSKTENADLFWQTCGGMGWTGLILAATFQLMRLPASNMWQTTICCKNTDDFFCAFESNRHLPYAAAWIDAANKGKGFGRGAAYFADFCPSAPSVGVTLSRPGPKPSAPILPFQPSLIRLYNRFLYAKTRNKTQAVNLYAFFYPLDRIPHWNRLYGRRGFIQYQCCLPEKNSAEGVALILEAVRRSAETPFLTVLKRHGERPAEAIHSFPIRGYSLALDFPLRPGVFELVGHLDEIVWALEGKIYLAKDACSGARMGRVAAGVFGNGKFSSLLRERIGTDGFSTHPPAQRF